MRDNLSAAKRLSKPLKPESQLKHVNTITLDVKPTEEKGTYPKM